MIRINETEHTYALFKWHTTALHTGRKYQTINVHFYDRDDWNVILAFLSPWRSTIEKFIPSLHYVGMFTNLICLLIFTKPGFIRRKSVFYLAALAFADLMFNLTSVLPHFLISTQIYSYKIDKSSNVFCFLYDYGIISFHFYSVLVTLLITIDRFDHIHKPLRLDRKLKSLKSKLLITFVLLLVSLVIALPHGFLTVYNEKEKDCDVRALFRQSFRNTSITYYQIYFTFTEPVLIWLMPGLIIVTMNCFVVCKIFKTNGIYSRKCSINLNSSKRNIRSSLVVHHNSLGDDVGNSLRKSTASNNNQTVMFVNNSGSYKKAPMRSYSKEMSSNNRLDRNVSMSRSRHNSRLSVNKLSHRFTIVLVGFYFMLSTLPYGVLLSLQNNLTFKLNYSLSSIADYLSDYLWIEFGQLRELVLIFKIFFIANHCFSFFVYLFFNRMFRQMIFASFKTCCRKS